MGRRSWISNIYPRYFSFISRGSSLFCLWIALLICLPDQVLAQEDVDDEEVPVIITIPRVGSAELITLVRDEKLYLPIAELFDFIRIKNTVNDDFVSVEGYFLDPANAYLIDAVKSQITYQGKTIDVPPGTLVRSNTNLYMAAEQFSMFGLTCEFNFRGLFVRMLSAQELPVAREMRLASLRKNMNRMRGELQADTTINHRNTFFDLGVLNWNVILNQQVNGRVSANGAFGFGALLAGGELSAVINVSPTEKFQPERQYYLWRHVNNNNKIVRQVSAGLIGPNLISSLFGPVVGVQINNRPTYSRNVFSTYHITRTTNPGWDVEVYVNELLVGYQKADSAGIVNFDVPLLYGMSNISVRYYGPFGENIINNERINIPYQLLPVGQVEYSASSGVVQDKKYSQFARGEMFIGISRKMTIGSGVEYLSSIPNTPYIPFINTTLSLTPRLILYGEAAMQTRYRSQLSYRLTSTAQLDMSYSKYEPGQRAININAVEERRMTLSLPLQLKKLATTTFVTVNQMVLSSVKTTMGELLFSVPYRGTNTQITTYGLFTNNQKPTYYSNLSVRFNAPWGFRLIPSVQVRYSDVKLMSSRLSVEKNIFKTSTLNIFAERNTVSNLNNFGISITRNFAAVQSNFQANSLNKKVTFIESFRGGVIYDPRTNYTKASARIAIGRGALLVVPFLDVNCNGVKDPGEPRVNGMRCTVDGRSVAESKDTTIKFTEIEPYIYHYLRLDKYSFDNIAWQIRQSTIKIAVEPNHFKTVNVPVAVMGEASGMMFVEDSTGTKGQGQITINFYQNDTLVAKTLSEPDGYFSYMGLKPGTYTVRPDETQMQRIRMTVEPPSFEIEIKPNIEGDVVEGLDFILTRKPR